MLKNHNNMTQKEALNMLDNYCKANGMHLTVSSYTRNAYAIVVHDGMQSGNTVMEGGVPCHRLSGYHKPTELLIWLDGYHAGIQQQQAHEHNLQELRKTITDSKIKTERGSEKR